MPALATVEDLCNLALDEVGYGRRIGNIYEGTLASNLALRIYGQTRDELLREKDWPFCRRTAALTLLKSADILPVGSWDESRPVPPWRFEYAYPSDSLFVRAIRPNPSQYQGGEPWEPEPIRFASPSDFASLTATTAQRVILTDQENALAVYTTRLTDLSQWEPLAIRALIKALAERFRPRLGPQQQSGDAQLKMGEAAATVEQADRRRG